MEKVEKGYHLEKGLNPAGSDQAIMLIFKQYLPKNAYSEPLEPHFQAQKCHCKELEVPGAHSFPLPQPPHALSP